MTSTHEAVQQYYGRELRGSADLKTDACCTLDSVPDHLKPWLARIHPDVAARYYGCGLIAPEALQGLRILDLGCGAGLDCFVLSGLVGEAGEVVGVDMTAEQLEFARAHVEHHRQAFGHAQPNVRFVEGYLERLDEIGLEAGSFDVIVSNCVLNLCTDKEAVLRGARRLLKPGGEFYFSDVYSDRRVPAELTADPVLYGECLSGALYWNDFQHFARRAGFGDPRLVTSRPLGIQNAEVRRKVDPIRFYSATYRLFAIDELEPACEDYGQAVVYRGTLAESPQAFRLDEHHVMQRGKVFPVCGNSWRMLQQTRFAPHFDFIGDFSTHYGIFAGCGTSLPFAEEASPAGPSAQAAPAAITAPATGTSGCC